VYHNGRKLQQDVEYFVSESGGVGSGYDTVNLNFSPRHKSVLIANYVIST